MRKNRLLRFKLLQALVWFSLFLMMAIAWPDSSLPSDLTADVDRSEVVGRWR
jgi:hypothetical protein